MNYVETAPAKINLFLAVTGKRPDGYHDIASVMQTVSLCDTLTLDVEEAPETAIAISCTEPSVPRDETNLAYRAASRLLDAHHKTARVSIHIEKKIPMCAGLAGGSADAAAVLRVLVRHFAIDDTTPDFLALCAKLGADVPFCYRGGTMLCEGIGERLTPLPPLPDCSIVIVSSGESVSTPWAYGELDRLHPAYDAEAVSARLSELFDGLEVGSLPKIGVTSRNDFEDAVFPVCPEAKEIFRLFTGRADVVRMSGSGSAVYGIFSDRVKAQIATMVLGNDTRKVILCKPQ